MPLEATQMLLGAFYAWYGITSRAEAAERPELVRAIFEDYPIRDRDGYPLVWGPTHYHHPCSVWVRTCDQNWLWTLDFGRELAKEYTRRYRRTHFVQQILSWCAAQPVPAAHSEKRAPFAQAMPLHLHSRNAVTAYRAYYREYKARFCVWRHSETPEWW